MNSSPHRETLEPLKELRGLSPPIEQGMQVVAAARRAIAGAHRRAVLRWALMGCSAAAASVAVLLVWLPQRETTHTEPAPAMQLKQAVQASNQFRGLVQINLEEFHLDAHGQPEPAPRVATVMLNTSGAASQPPSQVAEKRSEVRVEPAQRRTSVASTILIPLTWEGGTIPIPTAPMNLRPYPVGSDQAVTMLRNGGIEQYRIAPALPGENAEKRQATVWVDTKTGLVNEVRLRRSEEAKMQILKYLYQNPGGATTEELPGPR